VEPGSKPAPGGGALTAIAHGPTHLPNDPHDHVDGAMTPPPSQAIVHTVSAGVRVAALALIGSSTLLASLILVFRFSVETATLRAATETALTLFGLLSAWFIWDRCSCIRSVPDFLVLVAVLTLTLSQLAYFAVPAMLGSSSSDYLGMIPLIAHLEVAVIFAGAMLTPAWRVATRKQATVVVAMQIAVAASVAVGALLLYRGSAGFGPGHGGSAPTPRAIALTVPGVLLMLVAAAGSVRAALRERNLITGLPGSGAILLAAAWSYPLVAVGLPADSVSGRDCLYAGAFGLILLFALNSHRQLQRERAEEAVAADRRRLVCDLHDGMAQDLAFIATYAERLAHDFGPEHPLTVAARRALGASRGFIADVSASDAPTPAAALRAVADELSARHGVRVVVTADDAQLTASEREALVRIAREAIVNAVQHGHAQNIAVSLETRDKALALRISDDGAGFRGDACADTGRGFGLRAMRERTESIGGRLIVTERPNGGAAVEAVVS
jgi:signal transduction histidine kinase